jgi:hypothetical protein
VALTLVVGACGGGSGGAAPVAVVPPPAPAPAPPASFKSLVVDQFAIEEESAVQATPIAIDSMTIEYRDLDDPSAFEDLTRDGG